MPVTGALGGLDLEAGSRLGRLDVLLGSLGVFGHGVGGVVGEVLALAQTSRELARGIVDGDRVASSGGAIQE